MIFRTNVKRMLTVTHIMATVAVVVTAHAITVAATATTTTTTTIHIYRIQWKMRQIIEAAVHREVTSKRT